MTTKRLTAHANYAIGDYLNRLSRHHWRNFCTRPISRQKVVDGDLYCEAKHLAEFHLAISDTLQREYHTCLYGR